MSWTAPLASLGRGLEGLLDRALCLAGAVILSQAPEFFQQYLQRLGGHLDEARLELAQLRQLGGPSDVAPVIQRLAERVDHLAGAESALRHASLWSRPFVFAHSVDPAIARATAAVFKPAVPTTVEGAVYALLGMFLMLALYHGGVKRGGRAVWRACRRRPTNPSTAGGRAV